MKRATEGQQWKALSQRVRESQRGLEWPPVSALACPVRPRGEGGWWGGGGGGGGETEGRKESADLTNQQHKKVQIAISAPWPPAKECHRKEICPSAKAYWVKWSGKYFKNATASRIQSRVHVSWSQHKDAFNASQILLLAGCYTVKSKHLHL